MLKPLLPDTMPNTVGVANTTLATDALERSWLARIQTLVITDDVTFEATCRRLVDDGVLYARSDTEAFGAEQGRVCERADVVIIDARAVQHVALRVRSMRRRSESVAILVANARDERECERLLNEGADEACMPSSPCFHARVRTSVRRMRAWNSGLRVAIGDVVLDRERRRVWCAGQQMRLAPREYDLMLQLFDSAPRVVEKRELALRLWGEARARELNTTAVYIHYLRAKLAESEAVRIATVRSVGYALVRRLRNAEPERTDGDDGVRYTADACA